MSAISAVRELSTRLSFVEEAVSAHMIEAKAGLRDMHGYLSVLQQDVAALEAAHATLASEMLALTRRLDLEAARERSPA